MRRTQIYLTEREKKSLKVMAERLGRSQSELIRAAVDRYIDHYQDGSRLELLRRGRGLWKKREDLPDFQAIRRDWDRFDGEPE